MRHLALLLATFFIASTHAHWQQPPELIVDPIRCKGHPGTFATIHQDAEVFKITVYVDDQPVKTIERHYPVYKLQFSPGCVRFMMESENGKESIALP